jgi:hypothetical protein
MPNTISLSPIAQLNSVADNGNVVAFNVGFDGIVYVVLALKPLDYRTQHPSGASFAKTIPDTSQDYRILGFQAGQCIIDLTIAKEFNIHDVQLLPEQEILLVCARSHYRSQTDSEKNGRIYRATGELSREILLGDGIQSVQASANGTIWTSFFDEGVFGNYGWDEPIGESGLVAWDSAGNKLYDFEPTDELDSICDCYALNVESDSDVWLYYYTQFPLVHLQHQKVKSVWNMPIHGSDGFAICDRRALFRGDYDDRDTYRLFSLGRNGEVKLIRKLQFIHQKEHKIIAQRIASRGSSMYLLSNELIYQIDLTNLDENLW